MVVARNTRFPAVFPAGFVVALSVTVTLVSVTAPDTTLCGCRRPWRCRPPPTCSTVFLRTVESLTDKVGPTFKNSAPAPVVWCRANRRDFGDRAAHDRHRTGRDFRRDAAGCGGRAGPGVDVVLDRRVRDRQRRLKAVDRAGPPPPGGGRASFVRLPRRTERSITTSAPSAAIAPAGAEARPGHPIPADRHPADRQLPRRLHREDAAAGDTLAVVSAPVIVTASAPGPTIVMSWTIVGSASCG